VGELLESRQAWFVLLLAAAAVARLFNLWTPIDDAHEWRQAQTLMYAASYGSGASWLAPTGNWFGGSPRVAVLEFPIYSILAYLAGKAVGLVTGARLVSLACSLGAIAVFDRLCALLGHPRRRTATIVFALTPVVVFYAHATQPEALLLLATLAAAYCAVRAWTGGWGWAVAAGLLLGLAGALKPTAALVVAPPLVYAALSRRNLSLWLKTGLVGAIALVLVGGWAIYEQAIVAQQAPEWYAANTAPGWLFGSIGVRLHMLFYLTLVERAGLILAPPLTAGLILLTAASRSGAAFWWLWLAGAISGALLFAMLSEVHFYYELLWSPALAALIAHALPPWPASTWARAGFAAAAVAALAVGSRDLYEQNPIYYDAGRALAAASPAGRPVLVLTNGGVAYFPVVFFYADRNGWNLPLSAQADEINGFGGGSACRLIAVLDAPGATWTAPAGWAETARTAEYVIADRMSPDCRSG
jgi:4-amino-4-deoxy-L-arabinose transferase-like glycosyltransferase